MVTDSGVHFIVAGWGHSLAWALETQNREFAWGDKKKKKKDQVDPRTEKKRKDIGQVASGRNFPGWGLDIGPVQVTFPRNAPGQVVGWH